MTIARKTRTASAAAAWAATSRPPKARRARSTPSTSVSICRRLARKPRRHSRRTPPASRRPGGASTLSATRIRAARPSTTWRSRIAVPSPCAITCARPASKAHASSPFRAATSTLPALTSPAGPKIVASTPNGSRRASVSRRNMTVRYRAACALSGLVLAGCVTSGQGEKMSSDIDHLRQRLDTIEVRDRDINEKVAQLRKVLDQATAFLGRNSADLGARVAKNETDIEAMTGKIEEAKYLVSQLQQQVNA